MARSSMKEIEISDIIRDPKYFGMPTFDEFAANPDKYRKRSDEMLTAMDNSSQTELRQQLKSDKYEFEGYTVDSIEKLERILNDEGLTDDTVNWSPQVHWLADGSGKCEIVHRITRKSSGLISL